MKQICSGVEGEQFWNEELKMFQALRAEIRNTKLWLKNESSKYGCTISDDDEFVDKDGKQSLPGSCLTLESVKQQIASSKGRVLPGLLPESVIRKLLTSCIEDWDYPVEECQEQLLAFIKDKLQETVTEIAGRFEEFGQAIMDLSVSFLDKVGKECELACCQMFEAELNCFITLNDHYITKLRTEEVKVLKEKLFPDKVEELFDSVTRKYYNKTTPVEVHKDDLEAIEVMAIVGSYWRTAYKRYVDNICLALDYHLVQSYPKRLQKVLIKAVAGFSQSQVDEYLMEDFNIQTERQQLQFKRDRLKAVLSKLAGSI
ncbi:hypothetical protein MP228_005673 [Amoeboaphelidium protococcarum]|nr:hypothetical protein MP228_005673 [Amoeboaphelidium protococcarum]